MKPSQLRQARAALKVGVREVAQETGLNPNTISRIENGADAKQSTLNALADFYRERGVIFIPENGGPAGVRFADPEPSE